MRLIRQIALVVAALASLIVGGLASAQDLHMGVTYVCNGERLLIESCNMRDTTDTSTCMVQHPDRPQHNGFPAYTNETRGTLKTLLPTCKQPGAAQVAKADSARKGAQDKQDAIAQQNLKLMDTPPPGATGPTSVSRDKARLQRCLSAGRTEGQCAGNAFGNFFGDALNLAGALIGADKPETGLYFAGRYEGKGWRIDFTPGIAEMYCSDLVTSGHPYKIEFQGTKVALHVQNDPQGLIFALRDGKLYGPSQAVSVAGRIVVGTTAGGGGSYAASPPSSSEPTTTTHTTTTDMSPLQADAYVRSGGSGTVQPNGASYSVTETTTSTEYHSTPAPTPSYNTGPQVITAPRTRSCPAPVLTNTPERQAQDMGSALTSIAGIFGGSDEAPAKKSAPALAPAGLRMTGEFETPGGAEIDFRDDSAIVACGLIAAEYPYTVDLSGDHPVLRLAGAGKQPIDLTFGEKNTFAGTGEIQVTGRVPMGQNNDGDVVYAQRTAKCSLGTFSAVADGAPVNLSAAASSSGAPAGGASAATPVGGASSGAVSAHPNFSTAAKPLGNAVLTIKSGFPAQAGAPDPLGGSAVMLMRNPVAAVLAKSGAPVPAHMSGQEAIHSACEANKPECGKYLIAVGNDAATGAKSGANGATVLPGVPPGTYYLTTSAKIGQLVMYWQVKLELKAGANAITLDTRNAEPVK
jgi:hypothetical protein